MRFLIDECLSIDLVSIASQAGHEAQHVAHVGNAGWKDWDIARHAAEGDFVLVTNNASDFRMLCGAAVVHRPGHHHPERRSRGAAAEMTSKL